MTTERWQQIERLYHAALELNPAAQAAFLSQACAGDEDLRREVESLLESHNSAGSFIESPPADIAAGLMAERSAQPMIGRELGRYKLLSLIGEGGMGKVYLAEDTQLKRPAAIKLLPKEFTADRERVQRFRQEARAASSTNHPNIITVFEIGQVDDLHFIVTEFVDGQTLRQRLATGALKPIEAIQIAVQIAEALTAAHDAGIIHRDIKPENVMVRRDGYVKILDFGLAKLIEPEHKPVGTPIGIEDLAETSGQFLTDPGKAIGTPRYMSPEQIRGGQVDGRSDVFSLGVVIYELTTGRGPFTGQTTPDVIAAVLSQEATTLRRHSRDIPAELERIVNKALAKDVAHRYQTAKDLLTDLKHLKQEIEFETKLKRHDQTRNEDAFTLLDQTTITTSLEASGEVAGRAPKHSPTSQTSLRANLEPVGGAVPLNSGFYITRATDDEFRTAIARQDSIVLVKGARQVGKTSLLARGLQQAREAGARVIVTDFQKLAAEYLESVEKLLLTIAESFADQLDLDVFPGQFWNQQLSPGINFERYLRRAVFAKIASPIVWGLDEVDRLFTCDFGSEVFGLFRSWHNERALDPAGHWQRFTMAIAYATEAHLFITDLNQSPFNVGTRLTLSDFTFDQVAELNRRYGSPLADKAEVAHYFRLVGGHPYLVRRGLHEMATRGLKLAELESQADYDEGPFGDHLRRLLVSLSQDAALSQVVQGILQGQPCPTPESFYRLRSAGLMIGESARDVRPRCQLYATYLETHLL